MNTITIEFQDFTEIGGIGRYQVSVKASSIEDAERKVRDTFVSSWDLKPTEAAQ